MTRIPRIGGTLPRRLAGWLIPEGHRRIVRILLHNSLAYGFALLGFVVATAALPVLVVVTMGRVIGLVPAAAESGLGSPAGHRLLSGLVAAGLAYAIALVLGPIQGALSSSIKARLTHALQGRLMATVSRPPGIGHLEDPRVLDHLAVAQGSLMTYYPGDAPMVLARVVSNRLGGLLACLVVAGYRWWLGVGMALMWLSVRRPLRRVVVEQARAFNWKAQVMRRGWYLQQLASKAPAAKEARVFGLGTFLVDRFRTQWTIGMSAGWRSLRRYNTVVARLGWLVLAGYGIACGVLGYAAYRQQIDLTTLAVVLPALAVTTPIGDITWDDVSLAWISESLPHVDELEGELAPAPAPAPAPTRAPDGASVPNRAVDGRPREEIRFDRVAFHYPGANGDVFTSLDLRIAAGTSTAIVGLNGAGKTTLVKLLAQLYQPTGGRVLVDGQPLDGAPTGRWQRQVAVVFQDFARYPCSARDNIAFGAVEHADDEPGLVRAAELAGAAGVIQGLPAGWDTVLSARYQGGVDLSGGQWQRIALARALFAASHGARVLVLDEPTAWLDVRGEAEFFDRFLDITSGLTTLIISHRFSTVRRADRICVLAEGRVVEDGGHEELIRRDGRYAHLFRLQAERFVADGATTPDGAGIADGVR